MWVCLSFFGWAPQNGGFSGGFPENDKPGVPTPRKDAPFWPLDPFLLRVFSKLREPSVTCVPLKVSLSGPNTPSVHAKRGVLPLKNTTCHSTFWGHGLYVCKRLTSPGLGVLRGKNLLFLGPSWATENKCLVVVVALLLLLLLYLFLGGWVKVSFLFGGGIFCVGIMFLFVSFLTLLF